MPTASERIRAAREAAEKNSPVVYVRCPDCGQNESGFEKCGNVRIYIQLHPVTLEEDSFDCGTDCADIDTDDEGREIIYCNECAGEFTADELIPVA